LGTDGLFGKVFRQRWNKRPEPANKERAMKASGYNRRKAYVRIGLLGGAGYVCFALLAIGAGGCAGGKPLVQVDSSAAFQTEVLDARQPVMMLFFKEGCAACAAIEPKLEQLAAEYEGRALFTKYPLMSFVFISHNPELRDKYDIALYPTVILFFDGQEVKRWVADFDAAHYRQELDKIVGPPKEASPRGG
jgi:thioredoxin 1